MNLLAFLYYTVYITDDFTKSQEKAMETIRTSYLTRQQAEDVKGLETACRLADKTNLTFPMEEGGLTFLLYDEETLLSAFSAYSQNDGTWECTAFTLPNFRKKGCFTRLLHEFLEGSDEDQLIFPADTTCLDARLTLKALGAEPLYRELMMERTLLGVGTGMENEGAKQGGLANRDKTEKRGENTKRGENPKRGEGSQYVKRAVFHPPLAAIRESTRYTVEIGGQNVGSFHLIFQESSIYLYGLEISKPLRNKGYGAETLRTLINGLSLLQEKKPDVILLQVLEENGPAMSLYRKMGFRIVASLSYYVY